MSLRTALIASSVLSLAAASGQARAATPDPAFAKESGECAAIMLKLWEVTENASEKQNYYDLGGIMIQAAVAAGAGKDQMMGYQQNVDDGIRSGGVDYLGKKIDSCKLFLESNQSKLASYAAGG